MIVALATHSGDLEQAAHLLEWVGNLGGCPRHDILLVLDAAVDWADAVDILDTANRVFRNATIVHTDQSVTGWPAGANALWKQAAGVCKVYNQQWLWLEPDCVPLCPNWIDKIQAEHRGGFTGHIYDCKQPGLPQRLMSAIAVYPSNAFDLIAPLLTPTVAWDVAGASVMVSQGRHTNAIQHFWGQPDLPPTFVADKKDAPVNAFTLEKLHPDAVLFHRCKDLSLVNLLRGKYRLGAPGNFVVVLPFCNMDVDCMLRMLNWVITLHTPKTHDALLSFDRTTLRSSVSQIRQLAARSFLTVTETSYSMPSGVQFPQTAAWQHAARTMESMNRPWFWMEADCVPLKSNWLAVLQSEYNGCRKPFCGPIVQGRSHFNGTAIYPANTPRLLPRTMSHCSNAFDVECTDEVGDKVHDCRRIFQLAWGVTKGRLDELQGDELPTFPKGSPIINQIRREAVIFHREKSGTLIARLMERL